MTLLKFLTLLFIIHVSFCTPLGNSGTLLDESTPFNRTTRDRDGKFHPESQGDHGHRQEHTHTHHVESHSRSGPGGSGGLISVNGVEFPFGDPNFLSRFPNFNPGVLRPESTLSIPVPATPPAPAPVPSPPKSMPGPNGYANCGCVVFGQCPQSVIIGMPALLSNLRNDVVCGHKYSLCCLDDPWAGPIDQWADVVPCEAEEVCRRKYGDSPYDIQNYGVIGPCLGLGSVRCVDNYPGTVIVPIIDQPPTPPPTQPPTPPPTQPPTPPTLPPTEPPFIYVPPTQPEPPVVYVPPTQPEPPVVYVPPTQPEPPVVYVPPVVYDPPTPPPTIPPTTAPPSTVYEPPVDTYEPPTDTHAPPPVVDAGPPAVPYGLPTVGQIPYGGYSGYGGYPGGYGGGFPGYGWPYGGGFGYPGFGFRKRFHFSKFLG